jgi:hypothetical protein
MIRIALGVLALTFLASPASANPSWWRGTLPDCAAPSVLAKVRAKVAYGAPRVLGYHLGIEQFDAIGESALKEYGDSLIDRRYCRATAWLTNGKQSEVVYLIEATQGFASLGWNVESCLPSYDRWRVYDAWCRSIRP